MPAAPSVKHAGNQSALRLMGQSPRLAVGASMSPDEQLASRAARAFGNAQSAPPVATGNAGDASASPLPSARATAVAAAMHASQGAPLPEGVRGDYERFFRSNLSSVKVFADAAAASATRQLNARAFTHGQNVYFGPNRFQPGTVAGRQLIAHELTHTQQSHETFGSAPAGILRCDPDPPTGGGARPTLDSLIRANPPGFTDPFLDQAYQSYSRGQTKPADPRIWALHQTVGGPRTRLELLLGSDYARGQLAGTAPPAIDVRGATAPAGYDPARQAADAAALGANQTALTARLGNLANSQLPEGQINPGHFNILQGNVGEILARPHLDAALEEVRRTAPDAQLYTNVRAHVMGSDGNPTDAVQFSDGLIAAVRPGGLQIFRVAEIKSGQAGGVQGQEQIHRWIEKHGSDRVVIILPGVARTFEISDNVRQVVGLARAPRMLIAPRGAQFTTQRSGHGVAAPVQNIQMAQSAEEINYLTRVVAEQILQVHQARRLLAQAQQNQIAPAALVKVEELQSPTVVRRLLAENNGTALIEGQLYRVSIEGNSTQVRALPASTIAVPRLPGPSGTPTAMPMLPPGTSGGGGTGQTGVGQTGGGQPQLALPPGGGGGGPMQVPLPLPQTGGVPPNIINFTGSDIAVGGRVVGPTPQGGNLRQGELIVVGYQNLWAVADMRTRQPIAGVFEGGQWYRVISGGHVLPLDADGRVRTNVMPIPFAQLPDFAQKQPAGAPGAGGSSYGTSTRVVAGGLGIFVVVNEILGGVGKVLNVQRQNIASGRAEINFWIRFGGNPKFGVWSQNDREELPVDTAPDTAIFGSPSFPYVKDIDVNAFSQTLPGLIATYKDLLLFLDLAKTLGTIVEDPLMPKFPSPDERRQPRQYFALANKHAPGLRLEYNVTPVIESIRERTIGALDEQMRSNLRGLDATEQRNIFRLRKGSATPLFRSATGGQPILSDEQLLGDDPWVHPVGRTRSGSLWRAFRYAGGWNDRVLVEPANADAARGTVISVYAIKSEIEDVMDEVKEGGRPITDRQPSDGRLQSFVAGPGTQGARFGETRYYRMPENPNNQTAAIGELKQFWVNGDDLASVTEADVTSYANPAAPRTAP